MAVKRLHLSGWLHVENYKLNHFLFEAAFYIRYCALPAVMMNTAVLNLTGESRKHCHVWVAEVT